jgi:hypothetical protein
MDLAQKKQNRRFPRRRFSAPAGLLVQGHYSIVMSGEVGEGGMLIKNADRNIPLKTGVVLNFYIPLKGFVSVMGEKAYDNDYGTGFRFLDLSFESKRLIRDFIALKTANEVLEET